MSSRVLTCEELETHTVSEFPFRRTEGGVENEIQGGHELVGGDRNDRIERAAFEEGFRQGERAGLASAEERVAPLSQRLEKTLRELDSLKRDLYIQTEQDIVRLVLAVAAKIVRREIRLDKDIVETLIRLSLEKASQASSFRVRLNPDDYRRLMSPDAEGQGSRFGSGVVLVEDVGIEMGGCVVETDVGTVDARIGSQLENIAETLLATF